MKLQDLSSSILPEARERMTRRSNTADWHGQQAVKAYRRKDMDAFVRHVHIADQLWGTW